MGRKSKINILDVRTLFENGMSTYQIGESLKCNQSHVYRTIQKWNKEHPNDLIKVRTKSEAQKLFIDKEGHQRTGTSHNESTKEAISDKMKDFYDSEEGKAAKQKIGEKRREEWNSKTEKEKRELLAEMKAASREALKQGAGSKFENFVAQELTLAGFSVEQRSRRFAGNNLEVDIALANDAIAIEVDGPVHWMDVYGPTKLAETQSKDQIKNAQLNSVGWDVLRIQDKSGACSRARVTRIKDKIAEIKRERARVNQARVYIIRF